VTEVVCSETSVCVYQSTRRNIPEGSYDPSRRRQLRGSELSRSLPAPLISACPGLLFRPHVRLPLFLGACAELPKATVSFVTFVTMERLGCHSTDFHEI